MASHGWARFSLRRTWAGLSIYRKVLVLYFLCLIPVALFAGLAVESNAGQVREQVLVGALQTADIATANAGNFVEGVDYQMQMLAATPSVIAADPADLVPMFRRYLSLDTNLDDLLLIDATGGIIAQGMSLTRTQLPEWEAQLLQRLAGEAGPVILHANDWFVGRQRPIVFARPVQRSGQRATLVGVAAAWRLYRALNLSSLVEGSEVFLTDLAGDVIAHPNWMYAYENPNLKELAPVTAALAGRRGSVAYAVHGRNDWRLAGFTPVPDLGWPVVVSYRESAVLPPAQDVLTRGLAVLSLLVVTATLMAAVVGRSIVRPLEALTGGVEAVAAGDLRQRVAVRGRDELGRLSAGFNRMARSLEEMAAGLTRAREEVAAKARQLERLLHRAVRIQEEERRRIAHDLHDGMLQMVVGARAGLQAVRVRLGDHPATGEVSFIEDLLQGVVSEVRHTVYDLRPPRLESGGLVAALEHCAGEFQRTTRLACQVEVSGEPQRLPAEVELGLFRVIQESLQNVFKHARASRVRVGLEFTQAGVAATVADDGQGFAPEVLDHEGGGQGLGLLSMRERVQAMGGTLQVDSGPGHGTCLCMRVPLPPTGIRRGGRSA